MRFFMLLLIASAALAGAWPGVLLLWQIFFGAADFDTIHADGTVQHDTIGPASHWPEWALRPGGAKLTVKAHFDKRAGQHETGFGDLTGFNDAARLQVAYGEQLHAAGWDVSLSHLTVALPELSQRSARLCVVRASRDGQSLLLSATTDTHGLSRLHWTRGPQMPMVGAEPGACSAAH